MHVLMLAYHLPSILSKVEVKDEAGAHTIEVSWYLRGSLIVEAAVSKEVAAADADRLGRRVAARPRDVQFGTGLNTWRVAWLLRHAGGVHVWLCSGFRRGRPVRKHRR